MCPLRSSLADRQIKQPSQPSQKTDACSVFSLSYLVLCSPAPVFQATAGGDTCISASWLLSKTSPVYLPFAGITLGTHLSHVAHVGKSLMCLSGSASVCLFVCVNGTEGECVAWCLSVCVCFFFSGFKSTCEATFIHKCLIWHRQHLSHLDCILSDFLGSHIQKN